jgi:hypothetical protein
MALTGRPSRAPAIPRSVGFPQVRFVPPDNQFVGGTLSACHNRIGPMDGSDVRAAMVARLKLLIAKTKRGRFGVSAELRRKLLNQLEM